MNKVAILVDGGFYKKRAKILFGEKTPQDRASELITYCMRHIQKPKTNLIRIKKFFTKRDKMLLTLHVCTYIIKVESVGKNEG